MRKFEKKVINETIEGKLEDLINKIKSKSDDIDTDDFEGADDFEDTEGGTDDFEGADDFEDTEGGTDDFEDMDIDLVSESIESILNEIKIKEFKGKRTSSKSVVMSESELISFVKELVVEEAKPNGIKEVDKARKSNDSDSQKYLKDLVKKLKDYSSVELKKDTKDFPDRNKTGETKAYRNDKKDDEFIEDFAHTGMESLIDADDYDKNRNKDYVEGSSKTGNSDEYANSVKTDVNKNIGKKIKRGALSKEKKQSYNKDPQPITNESNSIKEEFNRMFEIINYNKKTQ